MKSNRWLRAALIAVASAASSPAGMAATIAVGRASFETPADQDWVEHTLAASATRITGGVDGQMRMVTKVLWLTSAAGRVDAVLVVKGSDASWQGELQFPASCESVKPSPAVFVRNRWRNAGPHSGWRDDCLVVAGPVDLSKVIRASSAPVADLLQSSGVRMSGTGYAVRATVAQGGTYLTAMAFIGKDFKGSTPGAVDVGASAIPAAVVQWGADLSSALKASAGSVSGKFDLPRIEMRAARP